MEKLCAKVSLIRTSTHIGGLLSGRVASYTLVVCSLVSKGRHSCQIG